MKNRLSRIPLLKQLRYGCDRIYSHCFARSNFIAVKGCVNRQHQVLFGVGLFLLLCWIIASIWLINRQREEQGYEEGREYQAVISMHSPVEMATNREMVSCLFTVADRLVAGEI